MQGHFNLKINGESLRVEGESANTTLLAFLRKRGYTAAKSGCSDGGCGSRMSHASLGRTHLRSLGRRAPDRRMQGVDQFANP